MHRLGREYTYATRLPHVPFVLSSLHRPAFTMDARGTHSGSDSEDNRRPSKRARRSPATDREHNLEPATNGNGHHSRAEMASTSALPTLSLSILGVEPLDEFIREIADFVHHTIMNRPQDTTGTVEVEAKIGVLKDKSSGGRIMLPILSETSSYASLNTYCRCSQVCSSRTQFGRLSFRVEYVCSEPHTALNNPHN